MSSFIEAFEKASKSLFEQLRRSTSRDLRAYDQDRTLPRIAIPGEKAFYLDDLLDRAVNRLGYSPNKTMADIVNLGIIAWYETLSGEKRAHVDLPMTEISHHEGSLENKVLMERLAMAQSELENERSRLIGEIRKLREKQSADQDEVSRLREELAALKAGKASKPVEEVQEAPKPKAAAPEPADDDPDPAEVQAKIAALEAMSAGYTELTAHSLTPGDNQNSKGRTQARSDQSRRRNNNNNNGRNNNNNYRSRNARRSFN